MARFDICPRVVELRHRSWSDNRTITEAVLARSQAAWVFIDDPKFSTSVKQELTAQRDIVYLRCMDAISKSGGSIGTLGSDTIIFIRRKISAAWPGA